MDKTAREVTERPIFGQNGQRGGNVVPKESIRGTDILLVRSFVGAMNRGATKAEALKKYGLSEEYFDKNVERVMRS